MDLCIPWERGTHTLVEAENAKVTKYQPRDLDVRRYLDRSEIFTGRTVDVEYRGVAIGARGGVRGATKRMLQTLGIGHGAVVVMQDMAIRGSVAMLNYLGRT